MAASIETLELQVEVSQAIQSLQRFEARINTLPKSFLNLQKNMERMKKSLGGLTRALTSPLRALTSFRTAIIGLTSAFAVKEFVNFGANFSFQVAKLRAVTGASSKQVSVLQRAIQKTGETTQFTATQAAEAAVIMGTLGKTAREVAKELPILVKAAGATDTAVQQMAESAGAAQAIFGITAKQATDVFAKAMSKTRLNVFGLTDALKGVGKMATVANLNFQQTAGILGFLAQQGIEASTSGIQLRNIIGYLANPTKEATKALESMGIQFNRIKDLPLEDKLATLAKGLQGIPSNAQKVATVMKIFRKEATPAVMALVAEYNKGNRVIADWNDRIASGFDVQKMYSIMMNTLRGDLIQLGSVIQGKLLDAFIILEKMFRDMAQGAKDLVEGLDGKTIAINMLQGAKAMVIFARTVVKSLASTANAFQSLENWINWVAGTGKQLGAIFSTMGNLIVNGLKIQFLEFRVFIGEILSSVFDMVDGVIEQIEKVTGKDLGTKKRKGARQGQRLQDKESLAFARLDYQTTLEQDRASFSAGSAQKKGGTSALAGIAPTIDQGLAFTEGKIEEYLQLANDYVDKQKEAEKELEKINNEADKNLNTQKELEVVAEK